MSAAETLITENLDIWATAIKAKSSAGRGTSKKIELYGIKKLRELILELAVRGLLVPQDPNDEPASELLKKIAAEKAKLVKEGNIKKEKPLPPIGEEEKPFELPKGWEWSFLPDICSYGPGRTPSTKNSLYWDDESTGIPWVSISDMQHYETLEKTVKYVSQKAGEEIFRTPPVKAGTLLMSFKLTVGKIAKLGIDAYHNEAIIAIHPFKGIFQYYLFRFLPAISLGGNTKKAIMGNTLNSDSLSLLKVPIPPLAEQHRIVAKVDEIMALCDKLEEGQENSISAHESLVEILLAALTNASKKGEFETAWKRIAEHFDTLFTTEDSISQLKQTILQLAVMGKLVPQDPKEEPADELLKEIDRTRRRLYSEKQIPKPKEQITLDQQELPFLPPSGWVWSTLGELCYQVSDGPHFSPKYVSPGQGVPFLSTRNVRRDGFDFSDIKYVARADHEEFCKRVRPEKGDIIYTKGGTTGIAKVNDLDFDFSVWVHLAVLRIEKKRLYPRYVELALNSPHCYEQSQRYTQGISNFDLGLTRMVKITIPLPPLSEQHRIVAKVDELMALCDKLKEQINKSQTIQLKIADCLAGQTLAEGKQEKSKTDNTLEGSQPGRGRTVEKQVEMGI